jgi:hypothetical protein
MSEDAETHRSRSNGRGALRAPGTGVSWEVERSRELISESQRILAESRSKDRRG